MFTFVISLFIIVMSALWLAQWYYAAIPAQKQLYDRIYFGTVFLLLATVLLAIVLGRADVFTTKEAALLYGVSVVVGLGLSIHRQTHANARKAAEATRK